MNILKNIFIKLFIKKIYVEIIPSELQKRIDTFLEYEKEVEIDADSSKNLAFTSFKSVEGITVYLDWKRQYDKEGKLLNP